MAVSSPSIQSAHFATSTTSLYDKLNSVWHERALQIFMAIVLAHWAEHLFQAYQIYVMGWPRPKANGLLGLWYPWLIKSEVLHYVYALVMLIGIWVLRKGFGGRARTWCVTGANSHESSILIVFVILELCPGAASWTFANSPSP